MKETLKALASSALTYILAFGVSGAASIVTGVFILSGSGWALVAAGAFLIAGAAYITKGLTPNG